MNWISRRRFARLCFFVLPLCAAVFSAKYSAAQQGSPDAKSAKEGAAASARDHFDLRHIRSIDSLSAAAITNLDDADAYVKQVAELCGLRDTSVLEPLLARLAKAELAATQGSSGLVSDDQVASAFNFMSDQFYSSVPDEYRIPHPQHITEAEVLQWRTTRLAVNYPHLFSQGNLGGVRPVGAVLMLRLLTFSGGLPDSPRKNAPSAIVADGTASRYRTISERYLSGLTPLGMLSFVESVGKLLGLLVV